VGNLKERDLLEDISADEDTIKMDVKIGWKGVEWTHLAQDKDKRRALINRVINLSWSRYYPRINWRHFKTS
jgi:hypothetical protein